VLQCDAVCCSVLKYDAVCCSVEINIDKKSLEETDLVIKKSVAAWCSEVQCGAVWCSVLQCVAVCCSLLQCAAVCYIV